MGLCTMCGEPLKNTAYVRCDACRTQDTEKNRLYHSRKRIGEQMAHFEAMEARREEIAKAVERERMFRIIGKCMNCVWAQIHTTHIFCPFPAGACMRL